MNYSNQKRLSLTELRRRVRCGRRWFNYVVFMLPLQAFWNSTDCNATFHLLVFVSGHHNSTGCNARFNLLHRALHNHNESKAERVCLGDGQCRWWRRCSFNTSMTTWPRLRLSALGMTSAAVIRNALDHLKEVADKLQRSATSCHLLRTTKCCPVKLWGTHILFNPWTRNTMDLLKHPLNFL